MTKIKLCGNFRLQDIKYVNQVKPDFAGIILAPGYRRSVSYDLAKKMRADLIPTIPLVGVFVDQSFEDILPYQGIIQYVQLHGQEPESLVQKLHKNGFKVIKVMKPAKQVVTKADYRLIDAGAGSGKTFDWQLIQKSSTPTILAGGLNKSNLQTAIKNVDPEVVDISSGSEIDGSKDLDTMKFLVKQVRELL